jgi:serine protease
MSERGFFMSLLRHRNRPRNPPRTARLLLLSAVLLAVLLAAGCDSGGGGGDNEDSGNGSEPEPRTEFVIEGTVKAASNSAIDSDINDPNADYAPNDTAAQAQSLPTPATLGGYINRPGAGKEGRSFQSGDLRDIYVADLLAKDEIVLNIAAPLRAADLDLFLWNAARTSLVDASIAVRARTETLSVPENGRYLIEVFAEKGASNYTLTAGQVQGGRMQSGGGRQGRTASLLRLSRDFVPGEVIVEFGDSGGLSAQDRTSPFRAGLQQTAGGAGRPGLFRIPESGAESFSFPSGGREDPAPAAVLQDPRTRQKLKTLYALKSLRSREDVVLAEPNDIRTAMAAPNDTYYGLQWHYPLINLPEAWDITTGSSDTAVAVIDTGVILDHPDLAPNISGEGYDFISDPARALDNDGIDSNPADPGDDSIGGGTFHGTHVAGTIAAVTENATGVAGVCWSSRILPVRVLGKNSSGTSYDILQGVRYAAGLANDSGETPAQPADIINLSFGGSSFSQAEQRVYTEARNAGSILVAAAGNAGENAPTYPAAYEGVVSVSAVDINANLAPYSNFGETIDVAAPGGDSSRDLNADGHADGVLSAGGDDSSGSIDPVYQFAQGTSMAAPHVAGVLALMKSLRPGMGPDDFDAWLREGVIARDLGPEGRDDDYGYGLIDAEKAVRVARDGGLTTVLNISPVALNMGSRITRSTLTASRIGGDSLRITDFSAGAAWLSISPAGTDENGLGTYTVTVSREGLSSGIYSSVITFASITEPEGSTQTAEVPVTMRVSSSISSADAGLQYVLLVDAETDETFDQLPVRAENGAYPYRLTGVPSGRYRIYAGTDMDNDFSVGDAGEAIGAYLSTDQPVELVLDRDRSGIDFTTEFNVALPEAGEAGLAGMRLKDEARFLKRVEAK